MIPPYKKLCTQYYDLEQHEKHDEAVAFYAAQAACSSGPILEPMCGTGRFMLPLLRDGSIVEGFDASEAMLAAFREKYAQVSDVQAPVWQSYAHEFVSAKQYGMIFIPYGSYGLIVDREQAFESLSRFYAHLAPGGNLFLEIETVASAPRACGVRNRSVKRVNATDSIALYTVLNYHQQTQLFTAYCRYDYLHNGSVQETEEEDFAMHLYRHDELDAQLTKIGFTRIEKYTDHAGRTDALETAPLILYKCSRE